MKQSVSESYMLSLGGYITCPKKGCEGKLVPVLVREEVDSISRNKTEIVEELECVCCGKIVKSASLLRTLQQNKNYIKDEDPMKKLKKWR